MSKDWRGNKKSIFVTLSAKSDNLREEYDYYATEPKAVTKLLEAENFDKYIWECACGEGHISKELEKHGHIVRSTDKIGRNFGTIKDFLVDNNDKFDGDIITNPPYAYAQEFVEKALEIIPEGNKVAMLLRIQFLEGKKRKKLFEKYPPKVIYIFSERIKCAKNGAFNKIKSPAQAFCWFIWEKGYKGETVVRWL